MDRVFDPDFCELWYALTSVENLTRARKRAHWLSEEEQQRASRFRQPGDSDLYLLAHVMLRDFLGRLVHRDPAALQFTSDPGGKPQLADRAVEFNLSHTRGAVVIGAGGAPLGVDIEYEDRRANMDVAKRFFSSPEYHRLLPLDETARRREFFQIWTLKEAWLKARGSGLAEPLDAFQVESDDATRVARVSYLDAGRDAIEPAWLRTGLIDLPSDLVLSRPPRQGAVSQPLGAFRWSLAVLAPEPKPQAGQYVLRPWPTENSA
jgi:4'-phosphopantetheinyl transferase